MPSTPSLSDSALAWLCLSICSLVNLFHSFLLYLGAAATVIAIAMDPFAQQLVQFEQRSFQDTISNSSSASIPRAQRYSQGTEFFDTQAKSASGSTKRLVVTNSMSPYFYRSCDRAILQAC